MYVHLIYICSYVCGTVRRERYYFQSYTWYLISGKCIGTYYLSMYLCIYVAYCYRTLWYGKVPYVEGTTHPCPKYLHVVRARNEAVTYGVTGYGGVPLAASLKCDKRDLVIILVSNMNDKRVQNRIVSYRIVP